MRVSIRFALAGIVAASWLPTPALAVDAKGAHRTRGVGQFECMQFVAAKSGDARLYRSFGGWIDGFLSAVNFYEEQTFDIAPWQTTDVIAEGLSAYCEKNPKLPFEEAVKRLVEDLGTQRLVSASRLVIIDEQVGGKEVRLPLYISIIERAQSRLRLLGYYKDTITREFDGPTRSALKQFQKRIGRPQTGLPDQVTLLFLFDQNAETYTR